MYVLQIKPMTVL